MKRRVVMHIEQFLVLGCSDKTLRRQAGHGKQQVAQSFAVRGWRGLAAWSGHGLVSCLAGFENIFSPTWSDGPPPSYWSKRILVYVRFRIGLPS